MKHYGDITRINGASVPPVNVIIGGSPCQDLSIAGNRKGLNGGRSALFFDQVRVTKEMRDADEARGRTGADIRPRYLVWENVPYALSSHKGEDFRRVLEEIARIKDQTAVIPRPPRSKWTTAGAIMGDGWSSAWRVLDAQFWGVPQRRRRIALVADFGGESAPEILFERKGVSGNPPQSETPRKGFTGTTSCGVGETGADGVKCLTPWDCQSKRIFDPSGIFCTLPAIDSGGANNTAIVAGFKSKMGSRAGSIGYEEDRAPTLSATQHDASVAVEDYRVRRLTPLECERLQGFPDGWTDIGDWIDSKGKKRKTSDRLRYKALGNSIAIPPWFYILQNLSMYCGDDTTMASLFDGVGGFPLIWEKLHGQGTCVWASEIEEFPIAVTKIHFPEEGKK